MRPEFEGFENFDEFIPAVLAGGASFGGGVEFGMARVGEEGLRHFQSGGGIAEVGEVLRDPLVIVGVVVDFIGQKKMLLHVSVIDASGSLLMPGGIVKALCL